MELVKFIPSERGDQSAKDLVISIRQHLLKQSSDSFRWPTDEDLEQALLERPLYVELTQPRIRRILSRIELEMRDEGQGKSENFDVNQKFTIEHLMPRKWLDHWPLPDYDSTNENGEPLSDAEKKLIELELARVRNKKLHTLGNLSLLTGKLDWLDQHFESEF